MNKVDRGIELNTSGFEFNKEVVEIFDSHVRKSVPMYDEFHKTIAEISDWYVENDTNVYDIGSSTGEVFKNITPRHLHKRVQYFGIDKSEHMIDKVQNNNKYNSINADIANPDIEINNASFITSVLTLQFISKRKRQSVINKIYDGLNKGSAFILVEKIVGNNARFDEIFIELYHDFKRENGLSDSEVVAKQKAIRGVMSPNTLDENINMLKEAGFKDIDVFFKWCNFVGIVAVK